jgi:hypothetical protein
MSLHDKMFIVLTPWKRVLLQKLTVPQLVMKFLAIYGIQWFHIMLTIACLLSLY